MTPPQKSSSLYLFSCALTLSIFILIIAGGLVTSKEAGLSVPDWPLSYGQAFPPMVGNIFWEHGHRMIAGLVAILTLIFSITAHRSRTVPIVKVLSRWLCAVVLTQALLGGLTVLLMLPPAISILHACLGQTFFCLAIATTYLLSPSFEKDTAGLFQKGVAIRNSPLERGEGCVSLGKSHTPSAAASTPLERGINFAGDSLCKDSDLNQKASETSSLFRFSAVTTGIIYGQLILGASVRHTGEPIVIHILVAFFIAIHTTLLLVRTLREAPEKNDLVRTVVLFSVLVVAQIFLGVGAFIFKRLIQSGYTPGFWRVFFTSAHQSCGALVLGASLLLSLRLRMTSGKS